MSDLNLNIDLDDQTPSEDVGGGGGLGSISTADPPVSGWWQDSEGGWWLLGALADTLGGSELTRSNAEFRYQLGGIDQVPSS